MLLRWNGIHRECIPVFSVSLGSEVKWNLAAEVNKHSRVFCLKMPIHEINFFPSIITLHGIVKNSGSHQDASVMLVPQ